jgi:HlyD family secretion protein
VTSNTTFRPEALEALDDPDRLGTALSMVPLPHRALLGLTVALVVAAVVAAALIRVPIIVSGSGILVGPSGTLGETVTAQWEGRVTAIGAKPGTLVSPGQEVAVLTNPGLQNERLLAGEELLQARAELKRILELQQQSAAAFRELDQLRESDVKDSSKLLTERLKVLDALAANSDELKRKGLLTVDRHLQIQADIANAREQIATRRTTLLNAQVEAIERSGRYEREVQQVQAKIGALERRVAALDDQIAKTSIVRATVAGRVAEVTVSVGDLVRFGSVVLTLQPDGPAGRDDLVAEALIPLVDGKKVKDGMRVLLDVGSVRHDVFGSLEARVVDVTAVPSTPEGLRQVLRNDDLVRRLVAKGPGYLATIKPEADRATPSGLRWTTSTGPETRLTPGTPIEAEVEVERVPVLSLVWPAVKRLLAGKEAAGETLQ